MVDELFKSLDLDNGELISFIFGCVEECIREKDKVGGLKRDIILK